MMPFIGETRVINPEDISSLGDNERLSLNKKGEIIASKGTLADGLYPFWARFCPNQARKQNQAILKKMINDKFVVSEVCSLPIEGEKLMGATIKLVKGNLKEKLEHQEKCLDQDLAETLYKNQLLTSSSFPKDTHEEPSVALKQITDVFKKELKNLPLQKEKAFNTVLKNFLDQNPNVSKEALETFLTKYKKRLQPQKEEATISSAAPVEKMEEDLSDLEKGSAIKADYAKQFQNLTKEIADVGYDQDKFFRLLAKLNNKSLAIVSSDDPSKVLSQAGRDLFMDSLLNNFTIKNRKEKEPGNPDVYELVKEVGHFLGKRKIADFSTIPPLSKENQRTWKEFANRAQDLLADDSSRRDQIKRVSAQIKKEVEAYQAYAAAERVAGRTPLPMKHRNEKRLIRYPLLSPDARDLLKGIIKRCSRPVF